MDTRRRLAAVRSTSSTVSNVAYHLSTLNSRQPERRRAYLACSVLFARWCPLDIEDWTLDGCACVESLAGIEAEESEEKVADPLTAGANFGKWYLEVQDVR